MAAKYIVSALVGSFAVAWAFDHYIADRKIFGGTTPSTVQNKDWWEETDKKFQAWPRTAGPPVVMNPISRQNFIVKSGTDGKLGSLPYQEVLSALGVKHDLKRPERTLSRVKAVILDAEDHLAKNHELQLWLGQLEAERYAASILGVTQLHFVSNFGHRIKEGTERVDDIGADRVYLVDRVVDTRDVVMQGRRETITHSFVITADVIGRKEKQ